MENEKQPPKTNSEFKNSDKFRGDSVDSHTDLEDANQYLNEGEISQQNNNL